MIKLKYIHVLPIIMPIHIHAVLSLFESYTCACIWSSKVNTSILEKYASQFSVLIHWNSLRMVYAWVVKCNNKASERQTFINKPWTCWNNERYRELGCYPLRIHSVGLLCADTFKQSPPASLSFVTVLLIHTKKI